MATEVKNIRLTNNGITPSNSLGIRGYDYAEYFVGSAKMAAFWHAKAMGLDIVAYRGPETGVKDRMSYLLKSKAGMKLLITSPVQPGTWDGQSFVSQHGDGFKRWSMEVDNVKSIYEYTLRNGAAPVLAPRITEDKYGTVEEAAIRIYDDAEICFVNYDNYSGLFKPGFGEPVQHYKLNREETKLIGIDHIVGNVYTNEMDKWAEYFNRALDFETFIYFGPGDISTKYSALLSKVVRSKDTVIRNPINEPFEGMFKSQIEEYTDQYHGTGIQHIAITTDNIIDTIYAMKENGVEFLDDPPPTYYEDLAKRDFGLTENLDELQKLGILIDVEGTGYLLQIFTKPIGDRPTFFYEIIQRRNGAQGFGQGNFQALFEAIERDQERRGNLIK